MNHTELDLERTLAYHGAPAMAGIKSADLIAWGSPEACSTPLFRQYQRQLARRGIQLRVIWTGCPRCLLLVYRPDRLERQLNDPAVRALLLREGYPAQGGLEAMLETLGRRLNQVGLPPRGGPLSGLSPRGRGGLPPPPGAGLQAGRLLEGVLRRGAGPPVLPPVRAVPGRPVPPPAGGEGPGPGVPGGVNSYVTAAAAALTDINLSIRCHMEVMQDEQDGSDLLEHDWQHPGHGRGHRRRRPGGRGPGGPVLRGPGHRGPGPGVRQAGPGLPPPWGPRCWRRPSSSPSSPPWRAAWGASGWLCSAPTAGATASGCGTGRPAPTEPTPWSIRTRGLILNETPDEEGLAQCRAFGAGFARD